VVAAAYLYVNRQAANLMIEKSLPQVESLILKELPASVSKEQVHEDIQNLAAKFQQGRLDSARSA
jgi:DNA gyrase/topoisomerase IV subunit A